MRPPNFRADRQALLKIGHRPRVVSVAVRHNTGIEQRHTVTPAVIQELVRVTRPGGWVELAECGVPQDGGPGYTGLWQSWIDFLTKRNVDFTVGARTGQMLISGGLASVQQRALNFPMGDWGGRIGRASATDCLAVGKALRAGVIAQNIMTADRYDALYARAQQEFAQRQGRGILPFYVAYGQKV